MASRNGTDQVVGLDDSIVQWVTDTMARLGGAPLELARLASTPQGRRELLPLHELVLEVGGMGLRPEWARLLVLASTQPVAEGVPVTWVLALGPWLRQLRALGPAVPAAVVDELAVEDWMGGSQS